MKLRPGLCVVFWAQLLLASRAAAQASPAQSTDSTFLLQSSDPARRPSPFIGNGHLGMVVPQGCYIRVGPEERTWEEGKMLVFDDSFEHEVWNHSEFVRIVLFMNFWHPCFADREIPVLERFRAAYEQTPLSRVHKQNQDAKRAHDMEVARVAEKIQAA